MTFFICQKCFEEVKHTVVIDDNKVIPIETAEEQVKTLLKSGKNTREISEITGLPLQNVNKLMIDSL